MISFQNKETTRLISYDVFVVALVAAGRSASAFVYKEIARILLTILSPILVENLPLLMSLLTGITLGFQVNLNPTISSIAFQFFLLIVKYCGMYHTTEWLQSQVSIDCTDYVKELPTVDRQYLPDVETPVEGESTSPKISYTRERPIKQDIYVSTDPDSDLYYQKDFEVETLDGKVK